LVRRSGAAGCMERAAQGRAPVALQASLLLPLPTTAMLALPIGWRDGVRQRRIGAAGMLARVARQLLEVVLESAVRLDGWAVHARGAGACAPSSGDTLNMQLLAPQFVLGGADM